MPDPLADHHGGPATDLGIHLKFIDEDACRRHPETGVSVARTPVVEDLIHILDSRAPVAESELNPFGCITIDAGALHLAAVGKPNDVGSEF